MNIEVEATRKPDALDALNDLGNNPASLRGLGGGRESHRANAVNERYHIAFNRNDEPANVETTDCHR